MRILFGNNYHYLRGGSERVYFEEMELLVSHGHRVVPFSVRDNEYQPTEYDRFFVDPIFADKRQDIVQKVKTAARIIYSFHSVRKVRNLLLEEPVELAHLHNVYSRLNTSIIPELVNRGVPVVLTAHDYKILCPIYLMYRDNKVCEECAQGGFYRCLLHRCNNASFLYSGVSVAEAYINQVLGIYRRHVRHIVTPSLFLRDKLLASGFSPSQVVHVPNFVDPDRLPRMPQEWGPLLFLGRLSREKGLSTLISAFKRVDTPLSLHIVGDGPLLDDLRVQAAPDKRIVFMGHLSGDALWSQLGQARAVIIPSEYYENQPMAILEAQAMGKPTVGSNIGGIPELIEDGLSGYLFTSGDADDLARVLQRLVSLGEERLMQMGECGRQHVTIEHSAKRHYEHLMSVYRSALEKKDI